MADNRLRDLDVVLYSELLDTVPQAKRIAWTHLAALLSEHEEREDKDGPGWSATVYRPSTTRGKAGVETVTALVFDIDHDEPVWSLFDGLEYVAHTTWKHHASSTHVECRERDDCPHWRIVLPLARPVPVDDWDAFRMAARFWLCPNADESAKDAPRLFWMPTRQRGKLSETRQGTGHWLDPDELRPVPADEPIHRKTTVPPSEMVHGERPGDRFEREADWCRDLLPNWKPVGIHGDNLMMRRPGSTNPYGATISRQGQGVLYVFTDGAPPLAPNTCYSKFWAYVALEHGGDSKVAARTLAERYGMSYRQNGVVLGRIGTNGVSGEGELTLPEIYADEQDLRIITAQAWAALNAINTAEPFMFRQGGALVRIETMDGGKPIFRELSTTVIRHEMARAAVWWGMRGPKAEKVRKVVVPPEVVCQDVLATPSPPLPEVIRIAECPVFGPDWALKTTSGYHASARAYCVIPNDVIVPALSTSPSSEDIVRARSLVMDELLGDFPFASPADRANALALFLLSFVRDAINGPTPLHVVESPTVGTGKGLLVDALLRPSCGRGVAVMAQCRDGDEWRKRITAALRSGHAAIQIDNVTLPLDAGELAMALTIPNWSDRLLGSSQTVSYPVRCAWALTANNPVLSTEMARRSIRIRLDSKTDRPWEREEFRHRELMGWVDDHRGELIWAGLTMIRSWIAASQPGFSGKMLGSFEGWSRILGGVIEHIKVPGFLGNLSEFYDVADTEGAAWRSFVEGWWETFGMEQVGTADLFVIALETEGMELGQGNDKSQRTVFGKALGRQRDRVIGDFAVKNMGSSRHTAQWRLFPRKEML